MSTEFDLAPFEEFTFEVEGKTYRFSHCKTIVEKRSSDDQTIESILKTLDGELIHLLVISDTEDIPVTGISKGRYTAQLVDEKFVEDLQKSLSV